MKAASKLLIFLGIILIGIGVMLFWQRTNPNRLSFDIPRNDLTKYKEASKLYPTNLTVKGVAINLPIIPARITDNSWETTTQGVSYLISSPIPGEKGNSILYGHNYKNILGDLVKVKPNDQVVITLSDKSTKTFIVSNTSIVTPDQTHIMNQTKDKRITLYTCTGFLDSNRFVVTAMLK